MRLNRAVALWHVAGADRALAEVETLAPSLESYHLFHATRAELLRALGRDAEARQADSRALVLTANPAERALLRERLDAAYALSMRPVATSMTQLPLSRRCRGSSSGRRA